MQSAKGRNQNWKLETWRIDSQMLIWSEITLFIYSMLPWGLVTAAIGLFLNFHSSLKYLVPAMVEKYRKACHGLFLASCLNFCFTSSVHWFSTMGIHTIRYCSYMSFFFSSSFGRIILLKFITDVVYIWNEPNHLLPL